VDMKLSLVRGESEKGRPTWRVWWEPEQWRTGQQAGDISAFH
jgi:hypothetical protein